MNGQYNILDRATLPVSVAAIGLILANLLSASSSFYGENDRSRWVTVRALLECHTYAIGQRHIEHSGAYYDEGLVFQGGWTTTDKVLDPETGAFYSSKPPLLATLTAGICWILGVFGLDLSSRPWIVSRIAILFLCVMPVSIYLVLLPSWLRQMRVSKWTRTYVVLSAGFGTFVTSFATSLTNHSIAAVFVFFSLALAVGLRRLEGPRKRLRGFFCGVCVGVATTQEFPCVILALLLLPVICPDQMWRLFPSYWAGFAAPLAVATTVNYVAIGTVFPAYALTSTRWYQFPGAAWVMGIGSGIDSAPAYESKLEYALNLLIGHHGLFSLTPVLLLGIVTSSYGSNNQEIEPSAKRMARLARLVCGAVVALYVWRTGNYGGMCCGPRWLLWMTPLLLVSAAPTVERMRSSVYGRIILQVALLISCGSAMYRYGNPWRHPWLYDLARYWDALPY